MKSIPSGHLPKSFRPAPTTLPQGPHPLLVTIPLRLGTGLNEREHWRVKASRVAAERSRVAWSLLGKTLPRLPAVITMTRIGKRKMDAGNLSGALKGVQDELAKLYGEDDGSDLYEWRYEQEIGTEFAVRIEIRSKT